MFYVRFVIRKFVLEGELCFLMYFFCDFFVGFVEGICQNFVKYVCYCRELFQLLVVGRMDKLCDVIEYIYMGVDFIVFVSQKKRKKKRKRNSGEMVFMCGYVVREGGGSYGVYFV